ncbi:phage terminase large subunit family protein [Vibrio vulnificus]|uniref:terminase gpA endonuclease subunit n=1 Tax=Vibrio vulnificus TaxID=672 RepID=UPI001A29F0F5|nr:terminase gpA endonuclease subunit [Vibrio vulnificus]EHU0328762.1 phage terminase large subunit family protein [Vibrio vulnificus]MDS1843076.1 phage terminase large subunit family protein [Vibrio vulnificus]HAT8548481.1 DNA packaging protein [Vibrio vulnificus]HDY7488212.1 phage terminase large subunit family protein [Vibrio vulnificus]HDY8061799.1 phage terminase large subunit family protein [Vibrio vulnificus]
MSNPISPITLTAIRKSVRRGLTVLKKTPPISGAEWANKHYRLASGSSQEEGAWVTLPFQVAILNMMCNRSIRRLAFQKSARIGWSKMMIAAVTCLLHQYKANTVIYQPTDDDAKNFCIDEIDGAWTDMPIIRQIFPYLFAKDQNNTTKKKVGLGWILDILGAATPKNMRRITKTALFGDEVDGWDWELGKEGDPISLARTRLEGAAFPMERWGTTPTNRGESHIERLMLEMNITFRFYLPCPYCDYEQVLEWGSKDTPSGMKWDNTRHNIEEKARTAHYQCCNCHQAIYYPQLKAMELKGRWKAEDLTWTQDGEHFFDSEDNPIPVPVSVGIHCWAAYNTTMTDGWVGLVREYLTRYKDPAKLKTFVNVFLGELWEGENGDKLDWEELKSRREIWWAGDRSSNPVPDRATVLTGGIDTQDDRIEMFVWAWGAGEECWLIDHIVLLGDLSSQVLKDAATRKLHSTYKKRNGIEMDVRLWCWDAMGHKTDDVYEMSRRNGVMWVIPIQGENQYGKPIQNFPRKKNVKKVYLTRLGTDGIKQRLYSRLCLAPKGSEPVPGCVHFPLDEELASDEFFKQLCSANKKLEHDRNGRKVWRWIKQYHAFDEALDGWNYAYAALNILVQKFGYVLDEPEPVQVSKKTSSIAELAARLKGG